MMRLRPPLLLPSNAPTASAEQEAPRIDFRELSRALGDAPILFPVRRSHDPLTRLEDRTASDLRQAWSAYRRRANVGAFVSLSEKVGLPLSLLLGRRRDRPPHVLIAHHLTSDRKRSLQRRTGYLGQFDRIIVLCRTQERYLIDEAGVAPERVCFVYDKVDHRFWCPSAGEAAAVAEQDRPILSVGRERRDYETLAEAARILPDRRFVIVASSPWSRATDDKAALVPRNVEVCRNLSWTTLRRLYDESAVVVVPLVGETMYAAGVNGVLEAMAMAKPVIVTETPGIADYIEDGVTARFAPPGDPTALATILAELTYRREIGPHLGERARKVIDEGRNLDSYVASVAQIVLSLTANLE